MDYYNNAVGWHNSATDMVRLGHYQQAIYSCCVAVELYLKSRLDLVEHDIDLETSHDVINIYKVLAQKYGMDKSLVVNLRMVRKYFNESRYPSNLEVNFDKELADKFVEYTVLTKQYIDEKCLTNIDDLTKKFGKLQKNG